MGSSVDRVGTISEQAQLAALADDHRRAILRRLMCGPSTLSRLGRDFDKHPAWIRHHLKRLEAVGLVEPAGERATRNFTEKFYRACAGAYTINMLIGPDTGEARLVMVLGSDDFALELLASEASAAGTAQVLPAAIGSLDGLIALRQGLADVAGCHVLRHRHRRFQHPVHQAPVPRPGHRGDDAGPSRTGPDGRPRQPPRSARHRGPAASGHPPCEPQRGLRDARLARSPASRRGCGTADIVGYDEPLDTHTDVALAVASGEADVGLGSTRPLPSGTSSRSSRCSWSDTTSWSTHLAPTTRISLLCSIASAPTRSAPRCAPCADTTPNTPAKA